MVTAALNCLNPPIQHLNDTLAFSFKFLYFFGDYLLKTKSIYFYYFLSSEVAILAPNLV